MSKKLLVVGSRRCTQYGIDVVTDLVGHIVGEGITIVSGLNRGIDALVHLTVLDVGGNTIGMLGYGFNYLKRDQETSSLVRKLIRSGNKVISPFKKSQFPTKQTFIYRNEKMVEMCDAVLVIEATIEGGAMSIAQNALNLNKPVFAVPGSVFSYTSVGTSLLIQNGVRLVSRVEDIIVI